MIELEDIGEGWNGDYNEEDPEDEPLLRFTCYRKRLPEDTEKDIQNIGDLSFLDINNEQWISISDGSYCTRLSANLPEEEQKQALEILMTNLQSAIESGHVKKLAERMSWIGKDWLNKKEA